jgi:hypothetical protein
MRMGRDLIPAGTQREVLFISWPRGESISLSDYKDSIRAADGRWSKAGEQPAGCCQLEQ